VATKSYRRSRLRGTPIYREFKFRVGDRTELDAKAYDALVEMRKQGICISDFLKQHLAAFTDADFDLKKMGTHAAVHQSASVLASEEEGTASEEVMNLLCGFDMNDF